MPHWKAILTYDGTPFNGWQIQPNVPTVQGTLAQAIHHITGESVLPQGSGRTDAGVHALAQVASFALAAPIPQPISTEPSTAPSHPASAFSPSSRPPQTSTPATAPFARHTNTASPPPPSAPPCSPPTSGAAPVPRPPHAPAGRSLHPGTHDFTSFAAVDPDLATRNSRNEEGIVHPMGSDTPPLLSASPPSPEAVISTGGGAFTAAAEKLPTIPDPFGLPAPSSTPPGIAKTISSSTESPAPASSTTWSAIS